MYSEHSLTLSVEGLTVSICELDLENLCCQLQIPCNFQNFINFHSYQLYNDTSIYTTKNFPYFFNKTMNHPGSYIYYLKSIL